jgi:hypothetical protein
MELVNKHSDVWEAIDGSGLIFSCTQRPEQVQVLTLETCNEVDPGVHVIPLAALKHVRSVGCHGRDRDRYGGIGWGSSIRYALYLNESRIGMLDVVVSQMGGCGPRFFGAVGGEMPETFLALCGILSEHQLWDVLNLLVRTYDFAWRRAGAAEFKRVAQAFVDGRLRKRKQRGTEQYRVDIAPGPDGMSTMPVGLEPVPGVPALVG